MRLILAIGVLALLSGCCDRWEQLPRNPDYNPGALRGTEQAAPASAPEAPEPQPEYQGAPIDTHAIGSDGTKFKSPGTDASDAR